VSIELEFTSEGAYVWCEPVPSARSSIRGDIDNLVKGCLDAFQGQLYHRDSQVVRLIAVKK
jgi:Holliday junction resolvase RusA-like endonuclease